MNKRGGPPVKIIIIAASLLGCVYLLYIYNSSQSRLREAEASAERYRRSDESKVAQLQDTVKEKDILQEKCESDRQEFVNRLNSLNSQHKMLKSQHDELEAENGRLQQDLQKVRDDNANIEAQRTQEFNQMKQEKELEIASLRDQLANMQRQNDQLQNEISSLKSQLENAQQQLVVDQSRIRSLEQDTEKQKKQHLMDQGSVRNLEKQLLAQKNQHLMDQGSIHSLEKQLLAQKQSAAAAANVVNQLQAQQGQQQNLQQQPQQQQQQLLQQQQNQAQVNPQVGVQPNDLLYQGQGQGQGQVLGVQNMNQNVNQNANNIIQAQNEQHQIAPANLDQQQAAAAAAVVQQGQGDLHQGQVEINNAQHQMAAPNMDGAPQAGVNQQEFTDIDVKDGGHPDDVNAVDAFDNLKVEQEDPQQAPGDKNEADSKKEVNDQQQQSNNVEQKALGEKQNIEPAQKEKEPEADNEQPKEEKPQDDESKKNKDKQNVGDVDIVNIHPPVGPDDNNEVVDDKEVVEQQLLKEENNGGEVDELDHVEKAQRGGVLVAPGDHQEDHDDAHPDIVHNDGQIFKPDFNVNNLGMDDRDDDRHEFDDNRDSLDNKHLVDTFHDGDDHDNRMKNEGPVNLQVQEPPNRNLDEDNHIPQQLAAAAARDDGQDDPNGIQPLQPQGQGQILMPDFGLKKRKDAVQVEGEGRKEAPMPHADM